VASVNDELGILGEALNEALTGGCCFGSSLPANGLWQDGQRNSAPKIALEHLIPQLDVSSPFG
jgi:hypothetical protein